MKRVLRVGYPRYSTDAAFREHIEYLRANFDAFDEITLFTEFDHNGYREPDEIAATVEILKKRIPEYRRLGYKSVGINLLCTLGHLEEAYDSHEPAPFGYMVSRDGVASRSCICPSTDACLKYIYDRYAAFAECGADFIWVDDDVRPGNHGPVKDGDFCFCDACISRYKSLFGTSLTREGAVRLFDECSDFRTKYTEMQFDNIRRVYDTVKRAVHGKHPEIKIGVMNNPVNVESSLVRASGAVMGRPGGGFYVDTMPILLFEKAFVIHSQTIRYPKEITDIQYEFESFNFQSYEKSKRMTELETTLSVLSGCNGALYSMSWFYDREDLTEPVAKYKKMWDTLTENCNGAVMTGVYCTGHRTAMYLIGAGFPVTNSKEKAVCACVLGADFPSVSDRDIEELLALGLYTDGDGFNALVSRGFGDRLGGKILGRYDNGMCERFSEHSVNGKYGGFFRNVFMTFGYYSDAYSFAPNEGAEAVSELLNVTEKTFGTSLYLYENEKGERIAPDGYMMPQKIKSKHKKLQISGIFDYLSRGRMPITVDADVKIVPTVSTAEDGRMNIMLTNATLDKSGSFTVTVNTERELYLLSKDGSLTKIFTSKASGKSTFTVDNVDPWDYTLIIAK